MPATKEQQQRWLREQWGELDYSEMREAQGGFQEPFCAGCGVTEHPLFYVGGAIICSADCGLNSIYCELLDSDEAKSQIGIIDDLHSMADGSWPPHSRPLVELAAAIMPLRDAAPWGHRRPGPREAYNAVLTMIDKLQAGETLGGE